MTTQTDGITRLKREIIALVDGRAGEFIGLSHDIHDRPEVGNAEFYASDRLTKLLASEKFTVDTGIAGHPTGFIARRKSKKGSGPSIGFLAEYDALPEIGHGCGHNIIGAASVGAAIALAQVIDQVGGELVVFGTPAEEGGENGSAKASYVKQNLFNDIDACLMIHPSNRTTVTENTLALDPIDIEFIGKPAHAAASPEKGINALDGIILLFNGINALRQQLTPDVRIHGIITHGGDAPNIIPQYAKARFFVRAATRLRCDEVTNKVRAIARGAALATGTEVNITYFQNQVDDFVINQSYNNLFKEIVEELGEEIGTNDSSQGVGSTDAGNVSHVVPTIQPSIKIGPKELVGHTLEFSNAAKSKDGDRGLILGIKALAITALILLKDNDRLQLIKDEFKRRKSGSD